MELLTGEEYKCLSFAARHILGWQDRINERRGAISFTMFEHGYTTQDGQRYGGTGLSRRAIQRALDDGLVKYIFLVKREATPAGQVYEISDTPNWAGLIQRQEMQRIMDLRRTSKARLNRTGKSDKPEVVSLANQLEVSPTNRDKLVPLTEAGKSDKLNQSHIQSHDQNQNQKDKSIPSVESDPEARKAAAQELLNAALKAKDGNLYERPYTEAEIQDQIRQIHAKYGQKVEPHAEL